MLETEIKKIRVALERIVEILEVSDWAEAAEIRAAMDRVEGTDSFPSEFPEGHPPAARAPASPEPPEPIGIDDKVRGLIALSKEMGYDYIYNAENNQLAVDNQVLNEWRRRHEGGDNSPDNEVPV